MQLLLLWLHKFPSKVLVIGGTVQQILATDNMQTFQDEGKS